MYVKVRTVDNTRNVVLTISKLTTVEEFKMMVQAEMSVPSDLQRLFYRGKQLENGYKLFDYNVNLNDVVQLMIKENIFNSPTEMSGTEKGNDDVEVNSDVGEELTEAESLYYKIGDSVDCIDLSYGAWFEATILQILQKGTDLVYRVKWDAIEDGNPFDVDEKDIRPRAKRLLKFNALEIGQRVMINHNIETPRDLGFWYDFEISKIHKTRSVQQLTGILFVGRDRLTMEDLQINMKHEIFIIESPKLLSERSAEEDAIMQNGGTRRRIAANCSNCLDNPRRKCRECGCRVCSGKEDAHLLLLCDECDAAYHLSCLTPPLTSIPTEDEWYCPQCKNDENEIVKAGDKLKASKKKSKATLTGDGKEKRDWGKGMACVGRTRECTLVPPNHKGTVPGVEVGTCWKFRLQASEAGVHRPHVAGIHGRETDCAYSLVLSGGYEDDIDNGDEFLYTGSGGRDLSGNKRTAGQSCDQTLTRMNKALALNCNAKLNNVEGAEATDWRGGMPVRVIRNYKLTKHSIYAPIAGNRYDGIYKVVKYYPQIGKSGFIVWRYVLRRDDPAPAPWTREGKRRIASLGLEMLYPDGYLEAIKKVSKRFALKESNRCISNEDEPPKKRCKRDGYRLEKELAKFIRSDDANAKLWEECTKVLAEGKVPFLQRVKDRFTCVCCHEIVYRPVTTPCVHNICLGCLKRSFSAGVYSCPSCRHPLQSTCEMVENESLGKALLHLYPGYQAGR